MLQIIRKLVLELSAPDRRSSRPVTQRISSLNHELWNHSVEYDTLEESTSSVTDKVFNRFRCLGGEQSHVDVAHRRMYRRGISQGGRSILASDRSSRSNILFFARWLFVVDVSFS